MRVFYGNLNRQEMFPSGGQKIVIEYAVSFISNNNKL